MNLLTTKQNILNGTYDKTLKLLYTNCECARNRYATACDKFSTLFNTQDNIRIFSAPGRTEVGGNHTDHQHGSVLAGAVNLDVIAIVNLNNDGIIRIKSEGYDMDTIDVSDLNKKENEKGRASALIRGVCSKFSESGCKISGFNAYTTSNVLKGSGLSSSAAFEVLIGNIINGLFNNSETNDITIAKIGQYAECEYFGKPCGLLDQMASSLGGFTFADFHDPKNPVTEKINLNILDYGYSLCVVDTGGDHANLTQDYADITLECKEISNALSVDFLRDGNKTEFYNSLANLRTKYGDRAVLRAFHFFNEQERVDLQKQALQSGDFEKFLTLVNQSGQSSYDYLQNLYSTSDVKHQGLCLAIAMTKQFLNGKGACRVHGGGFAGTIQCYIPNELLNDYKTMIEKIFGINSCSVLSIRPVGGIEIK